MIRTARTNQLEATFLVAVAAAGALLGATIGSGLYSLVLALPVLLFSLAGVFRPATCLGVGLLFYSLMQVGMVEVTALEVGKLSINAAQLYVIGLLGVVSVGVAGRSIVNFSEAAELPLAVKAQLPLAAWLCAVLLVGNRGQVAIACVARHASDLLVLYLAFSLARRPDGSFWIRLGIGGATAIAAISCVVELLQQGSGLTGSFRATGTFGGPVQTGTICLVGLAFFVSQMPGRRAGRAGWLPVAILTCGMGILATFSRTAILGAILFAVFLMWGRGARDRQSRLRSIGYGVTAIGAILIAVWATPAETIQTRTADLPFLGEETSVNPTMGSGRGQIWAATLGAMRAGSTAEMLFGQGVNSVAEHVFRDIGVRVGAHNSYLEVLLDAGVIGLLLYLVAIGGIMVNLRSVASRACGPDAERMRVWGAYMLAYFLSTELFNGYIYALGPRFFTWIVVGYYLAQAVEHRRPGDGVGAGAEAAEEPLPSGFPEPAS